MATQTSLTSIMSHSSTPSRNVSGQRPSTGALSRDEALKELGLILNNRECLFVLIPFEDFRYARNLRSERYKPFYVLCHINTRKDAGWLVCKYVLTNGCRLRSSIMAFNARNGGTGRLERHIKQHESEQGSIATLPRHLSQASKAPLARSAAMAVAFDLRPISFTDGKYGMQQFVYSVFRAGQGTPISDSIEASSVMPSARTVATALGTLAREYVLEYKNEYLPQLLKVGGGVSTDGVSLSVQDTQFYDLTLHFIQVKNTGRLDRDAEISMKCKTLLLQPKPEYGTGANIREMLSGGLEEKYNINMTQLTSLFTMVTDCASVMARVALSSVSTRVAPMDHKWVGCLSHQLNTAMKCMISALDGNADLDKIFIDLQNVKCIVRVFKQGGWNGNLPTGYHLIQECETRFATTFSVVERFLKSSGKVSEIISRKDSQSAAKALENLEVECDRNGEVIGYPAVEALVDAFGSIVEAQTRVQASKSPTLHLALPLMQSCHDELERVAQGGAIWRDEKRGIVPPSAYSKQACRVMLEWLEAKVRVHDLWLVGCLLHPLLREFQFIPVIEKRTEFASRAMKMTRSLMRQVRPLHDGEFEDNHLSQQAAVERSAASICTEIPFSESVGRCSRVGAKRVFSLMEYADSHFESTNFSDELTRYMGLDIGSLRLDRKAFMADDFAAVRFWHNHRSSYPTLFAVSRRVYAIPVSSCASERVFSAVNRVVTRDRASTGAKTLEDIILVRSLAEKSSF